MQYQQRTTTRQTSARRALQGEIAPGTLTTALSIGVVVLIVAITFLADWLRVPELTVSSPGQFLSPNGDGSYDLFTINYRLSDDARISARVISGANIIRTLAENQTQPAGDHFISWDGRTDQGAAANDGLYQIEITASGATRSTAQSVSAQVDTQPPLIQLANLPEGTQVNKADLILEGITEPGAVVWMNNASQPLRVDNMGRFNFQYKLLDGANRIEIQATDAAGNLARLQRTINLVLEPPDIVLTRPLENEWTNQPMLTIEGRTRPGASLTINQQPIRIETDGSFRHQIILNEGDNTLRMIATDSVGNVATIDRIVHLKTGGAQIQLNVQDGANVGDPNLQLIGRVDPGSIVTVNGQAVALTALGDFQVTTPLNTGENTIQIESRDLAGNITRATRRVTYDPSPTNGISRLSRNLEQLPILLVPSALVVAGLLAFIYMRQNRVALSLSVDQPVFVPGTPGDGSTLEISLDLSKTARVSLEVYDPQGNARATILYNRRKIGRRHIFHWNGYDDRGLPLAPGEYTVQAEAGAPPLQVTSAVQVRIERQGTAPVQNPAYVRGNSVYGGRQER